LVGRHSTTWAMIPVLFALVIFWIGFCVFVWGQPWTTVLLPMPPT
jgi:hypothetical protein